MDSFPCAGRHERAEAEDTAGSQRLARSKRTIAVAAAVCLCAIGCSQTKDRDLDSVLSTNRIDRIEVVDYDQNITNILSADAAERLLLRLMATNRVDKSVRGKSYISGGIELYAQGRKAAVVSYFPREQILSYKRYEFSFRDTNDLSTLFR